MYVPRFVIAWAINLAALWVADALWDSVTINGWAAFLIGSAVLGIANAVIRPILTVVTLPLIIVTLGVFFLVINMAMIALAEWIAPNFSIDGFWTYVGTVVVVSAVNWIAELILGGLERRARLARRRGVEELRRDLTAREEKGDLTGRLRRCQARELANAGVVAYCPDLRVE